MRPSDIPGEAPSLADAERVAAFVIDAARRVHGPRWDEGVRRQPFATASALPPSVAHVAHRRVRGVPELVARGLVGWARDGRPAEVTDHIPTAADVLALQATGRRCVSLVSDTAAAAHGDPRHPDALTFVLHDLCHLEKFVEPEHHRGQRGFFGACLRLAADGPWRKVEAGFDAAWFADRDYVFADMNGSAIFLFAALKMKLNMAIRRCVARQTGRDPPTSGPLAPHEREAYQPALEVLLATLGMPPAIRDAARQVSARRDAPAAARELLGWFESV